MALAPFQWDKFIVVLLTRASSSNISIIYTEYIRGSGLVQCSGQRILLRKKLVVNRNVLLFEMKKMRSYV